MTCEVTGKLIDNENSCECCPVAEALRLFMAMFRAVSLIDENISRL